MLIASILERKQTLLTRWVRKEVPVEILIPNAEAIWIGSSSNYALILTESDAIPNDFWDSCRVVSDSSGSTLGFILSEADKVLLSAYDTKSGNHMIDSVLATEKEKLSPRDFCNLPDNITWVKKSEGQLWAMRSDPAGINLPPGLLSPLSYLKILRTWICLICLDSPHYC